MMSLYSVQPRVRGDHPELIRSLGETVGSAPRARGPPPRLQDGRGRNTVQPRVRGDHRFQCGVSGPRHRFSPACAGTTSFTMAVRASMRGSAPRVREPLDVPRQVEPAHRFSPACAGTTRPTRRGQPSRPVQPRVCGDHDLLWASPDCRHGSAPRVRGPQLAPRQGHAGGRFSPACAGTTGRPGRRQTRRPVQPRVCGDHSSRTPLYPNGFYNVQHPTDVRHRFFRSCFAGPTVRAGPSAMRPVGRN